MNIQSTVKRKRSIFPQNIYFRRSAGTDRKYIKNLNEKFKYGAKKVNTLDRSLTEEYGEDVAAGVDVLDGDLDQVFGLQRDAAGLG